MQKPARSIDEMPEVLSIDDLAEVLRCSPKTITRALDRKDNLPTRLPAIDASHRWARATVKAWLENPGTLWKSGTRRIA